MFLGGMLSYERAVAPKLGIGVDVALDLFGYPQIYNDGEKVDNDYGTLPPLSFDAFARLYPWAGKFFVHLGLGVQMSSIITSGSGDSLDAFGFHAKLQAGWRVDIGQPNHWVFEARLGPGISMGDVSYEGEKLDDITYFLVTFPIQLGFGYRF
jgi:hypothetical protein